MELNPGETIKTYINIRNFDEPGFIMMATADGIVKRRRLKSFPVQGVTVLRQLPSTPAMHCSMPV